jgi:hypothetical protein
MEKIGINKSWLIYILCFVFLLIYFHYQKKHNEFALNYTTKTYAILKDIHLGSSSGGARIGFYFYNEKNKRIDTEHSGNCKICTSVMSPGDTIFIKYSVKDNKVAEIIHCFWNEKLRRLVNEQDNNP